MKTDKILHDIDDIRSIARLNKLLNDAGIDHAFYRRLNKMFVAFDSEADYLMFILKLGKEELH